MKVNRAAVVNMQKGARGRADRTVAISVSINAGPTLVVKRSRGRSRRPG